MGIRSIIFRGKRLDNGEWVEGFYVRLGSKDDHILTGKLSIVGFAFVYEHHPVIPKTVGQYTGLVDKNGFKIFEGDIVQNVDGVYIVKYCESLTRFALVRDSMISGRPVSSGTVVGNIHDNPELIGGTP